MLALQATRKVIYRMSQEERSIFWEVIVSVILSKKPLYEHVSYSERFPRYRRLTVNRKTVDKNRWSHENPHGTVETNFQRCFSINVWCGMIDDMLIGPVILDDLLQDKIT